MFSVGSYQAVLVPQGGAGGEQLLSVNTLIAPGLFLLWPKPCFLGSDLVFSRPWPRAVGQLGSALLTGGLGCVLLA